MSWLGVARVAFWLLRYWFGVIDAEKVALAALRDFSGQDEKLLMAICEQWFRDYVLKEVRAHARSRVERHRRHGDVLAIVTGTTRYAAEPLARELGIEHVVCSELEVNDHGRLTGKPIDPLCYGEGKVRRAERLAERLGFRLEEATFYSDSITDRPLLERVGTPIVVCPDRRLLSLARRRGWPVEHW
jgi:HAD superfamily hydrolase (TIGR01490 family)